MSSSVGHMEIVVTGRPMLGYSEDGGKVGGGGSVGKGSGGKGGGVICVARNDIFSIKWRHYGLKRDILYYWEHLYFVYYYIISYQGLKVYRVESMDKFKISLNNLRHLNIKMQPSQ